MSHDPAFFNILIAHQQASFRQELAHLLSQEGYAVRQAGNSETAWHEALHYLPHLVIADRDITSLDGNSFLRQVRQHSVLRRSYIFVISTTDEEEAEALAFCSGADEYLLEPIRLQPLMSRIRALQKKIPSAGDLSAH
jgi:DNA-binding response OmpR family regulator